MNLETADDVTIFTFQHTENKFTHQLYVKNGDIYQRSNFDLFKKVLVNTTILMI